MNKIRINVFDENEKPYDRDPSQNTYAQFLVNAGLYDVYEISKDNIQDVIDVINGYVRINIYCKDCGESRIFSMKGVLFPLEDSTGDLVMRSLGRELSRHQNIQEICVSPTLNEKNLNENGIGQIGKHKNLRV